MKNHVKIFSELGGFAIFCESLLVQEVDLLDINSDLLSYLANSSDSEDIIKKGLIFPINEIEDGLYTIYLEEGKNCGGQKFISDGNLSMCGIGYLADFNIMKMTNNNKLINFPLESGEYILSWKVDIHLEKLTIVYTKIS